MMDRNGSGRSTTRSGNLMGFISHRHLLVGGLGFDPGLTPPEPNPPINYGK